MKIKREHRRIFYALAQEDPTLTPRDRYRVTQYIIGHHFCSAWRAIGIVLNREEAKCQEPHL